MAKPAPKSELHEIHSLVSKKLLEQLRGTVLVCPNCEHPIPNGAPPSARLLMAAMKYLTDNKIGLVPGLIEDGTELPEKERLASKKRIAELPFADEDPE